MREVALDTETTGLDPSDGHRVVEIGCVELLNQIPSGREFQAYVNPERAMPEAAFRVHGLSTAFLGAKPKFAEVVAPLMAFLGEARLVIHNAAFDLGFLNAELSRLGMPAIADERAIDTVALARRRFPGAQANLDALCRRFGIAAEARKDGHGALLDAKLLAQVYLELVGGRQPQFGLAEAKRPRQSAASSRPREARPPHPISADEERAHAAMVESLTDPIWKK